MKQLNSTLPANEARTNFYRILDEAGQNMRQFTISHRGKPGVVIMSAEEFTGWMETLDILSDKKTMESLRKASKSKIISSQDADKLIGW